ncbi:MAG TPA: RNA polymerase sigma factor, partial [Candidatus Limnocylindrales bacterium]|nr:RNA polymerase sigma factor [Candidatus Limnocylindrales bacterium]
MMTKGMSAAGIGGDAELVHASLAGNREAFGQIVERYQSLVCSLAYSATGSLGQSEDLAQETFLTAWKHLAGLQNPAKLRAWLCGIARNLINNWRRAQGREPSHRAESLEQVPETPSPEPLPVDRAISREEADILWRSLERLPETYRLPLVLFYREHQSVEAVAQNLELTEDAAKQRLSRGRKLLQEEVLAFVEMALQKSAPGKTFTVAVVASLPILATSAKAVSLGLAAAKGTVGTKSLFSFAALGGLATMLGGFLLSWKNAIDDTKSARERKFVVRLAYFQVALFAVSLVIGLYVLVKLIHRPLVFGITFALLLVANIANGVVLLTYVVRRRIEIGMEEGTLIEALEDGPVAGTDRKVFWKAAKSIAPFVLMFTVASITFPWKLHWVRCTIVVVAASLVFAWSFQRQRKVLSLQFRPCLQSARSRLILRHPLIALGGLGLGTAVLAGGLGFILPTFLHPGTPISYGPVLRAFGSGLLIVLLVCVVFGLVLWLFG